MRALRFAAEQAALLLAALAAMFVALNLPILAVALLWTALGITTLRSRPEPDRNPDQDSPI